jgi:hypothetical protein
MGTMEWNRNRNLGFLEMRLISDQRVSAGQMSSTVLYCRSCKDSEAMMKIFETSFRSLHPICVLKVPALSPFEVQSRSPFFCSEMLNLACRRTAVHRLANMDSHLSPSP